MKRLFFILAAIILWTVSFATNHQGYISSDQTWYASGNPHIITGHITVNDSVTLTIEPGCQVLFNGNYRFTVLGKLMAVGTAVNQIIFSSNKPTPAKGDWQCLYFFQGDAGSKLEYCDISYGGSVWGLFNITSIDSLTISNCTLSNSASVGIRHQSIGAQVFINSCTITGCNDYPITTWGQSVKNITGIMNISGNTPNAIYVGAQSITTASWINPGVPYIMAGSMTVPDGNTLTLTPGTVLKFNSAAAFTIYGALVANGTSDERIVFTSNQTVPTNGYWGDLFFNNADPGTKLNNCDISYGGRDHGGICLRGATPGFTVTNCTISNSLKSGIYFYGDCTIGVSDCSILNGSSYAISTFGARVKLITGNMVMTGNNPDAILVNSQAISTGTWLNHHVPYVMNTTMDVSDGSILTIEPGNELQFKTGAQLRVRGALVAQGDPLNKIVFTSDKANPAPGDWAQLLFDNCDAGTILQYCEILYGGAVNGGVNVYSSGSNLTIANSTIAYNANNGVNINNGSNPKFINTSIFSNENVGVHMNNTNATATFGSNASEWNEIYDNGSYELRNGVLNTAAKYVYWGTVDCDLIAPEIYDKRDAATQGTVNYVPWIDEAHMPGSLATTWTGNVNTDWAVLENWSGFTPCELINVTIPSSPANQPVVSSDDFCKDLTLEAGACLTVQTGNTVAVKGDLTLNADATGTYSLIETGNLTVAGNTSAQYFIDDDRYHCISIPLSASTALPFLDMYLYSYIETTGEWFNIIPTATPLNVGQGYIVWSFEAGPGTKSITFDQGVLNNGTKNLPVTNTGTGWNLAGNPYPSAIGWDNPGWIRNNLDGTVYVWDGIQYITWNGSLGTLTGGVIPAMQAFFVKANDANPQLQVSDDVRIHGPDPYKESGILQLIGLTVDGNGYSDKMFINFNSDATAGFDSQFDGHKLFGLYEAPQIFSYIGDAVAAVNVLPKVTDELIIPVGLKVGAEAVYTLTASDITGFEETTEVYLEDLKLSGEPMLMGPGSQYAFVASPEDDELRFRLHFGGVAAVPEIFPLSGNNTLQVYSFGKSIFIRNKTTQPLSIHVKVYDILGQQVLEQDVENLSLNRIDMFAKSGNYIVQVTCPAGVFTQKVFIE